MKSTKLVVKLICTLCSIAIFSVPAEAATIPQAGDNPIVIDQIATTDNITYLMAAAASRPDTTSVNRSDNGFRPKHFWLESISSSEPIEWSVQSAVGEDFHVTTLVNTQANQSFRLEVVGGGPSSQLNYTVSDSGWQRHNSGTIFIPAGTNTLRLTRTSNTGDINLKSLELLATADKSAYDARVAAFKGDVSAFSNYDYGVMFQYGAWGYPQSGPAKSLNDQAADFDVLAFVQTIKNTGAKYVIWSATWWTYEFNAPVAAVDSLVASDRTSTRDLIGDLATAFDNEGIDFFLYYHTGQDSHLGYNSTDWWQAQGWPSQFTATAVGDKTTFFTNWKAVISELGNRYGTKLDGWFFDDGLVYYPAPFEDIGAAAKAGNPDRLISYNSWVVAHYTDFEDLSFGEECKSGDAPVGGTGLYTHGGDAGTYGHCMPRMENDWGIRSANQSIGSPNFTVASATSRVQDASSRNVPTSFNLMMYEDGTMAQASLNVLTGLKAELEGTNRINDNDTSIIKSGAWNYSSNRGAGDYNDDVSYTGVNGAYAEYTFTGTGAKVVGPHDPSQGNVEIFIDNVSQGTFNTYGSTYAAQQEYFSTSNLSAGSHTVKIVKLGGTWMQLDSIDVTPVPETNLALAGTASQSTTDYGGSAARAIDGNTDGTWSSSSTTHTANTDSQPYWDLDLGAIKDITNIKLWNRTDCCSGRLTNFHVFVSDAAFTGTTVAASQSQSGVFDHHNTGTAGTTVDIAVNRTGRYVRVQLSNTVAGSENVLSLAEVQVMGN